MSNHKQRVLDAINSSRRAMNISEIARKAGVKWETADKHTKGLLASGDVQRVRNGQRYYYEKQGAKQITAQLAELRRLSA